MSLVFSLCLCLSVSLSLSLSLSIHVGNDASQQTDRGSLMSHQGLDSRDSFIDHKAELNKDK